MMAKSVYKTVIFGAGQIGQMTARLLSSPCQLLCFADNDPHKHGSYIGNIPVCSPDTAAALLPDLVILGVLDEERRNSMIKQMENLGYHGPFRDPSVLRMFDARVAVMRLLSEQIYQLDIPGNVAELGVFRGEFSSLISAAFPDRKIHLFDTFEGFSEKDITIEASGNLSRAKTGDFSSTDIDSVLHVMPDPTRTVIHKGWFPDTFSDVTDETFCFVSLDADLYAPTAAALPLFYERLATGGVLLIHDVYSTQFSGCRKAVGEFCLKTICCRSCMRSAWKRNDPKIIKRNAGTGIYRNQRFFFIYLLYSPFPRPCLTFIKFLSEHFPTVHRTDQHDKKDRKIYVFLH